MSGYLKRISLSHDIAIGTTCDSSAIHSFDPILNLLFQCVINV